jgi:DNA-binding transcriptional regulator YiaG
MANFANTFKEEIQRIARRELKKETGKLVSDNKKLRDLVSKLNKRVRDLESLNRTLLKAPALKSTPGVQADKDEVDSTRLTGARIKRLRAKFKMTQAELADLLGVSSQSVYQWERKEGKLTMRGRPKAAVVEILAMSPREAHEKLDSLRGMAGGASAAPDSTEAKPGRKPRRKAAAKKTAAKGRPGRKPKDAAAAKRPGRKPKAPAVAKKRGRKPKAPADTPAGGEEQASS